MQRRYPIGIQTFEDIIDDNYVYVDKTELVYKLVQNKSIFLSRPRRFGKSLLCSTLKCYFQGKKEYFKGLLIENLEKNWTKYEVIHLSLAGCKSDKIESIVNFIDDLLLDYENKFSIVANDKIDFNIRFKKIIEKAYEQSQNKVVIIIDEYDAQMLNSIDNEEVQNKVRIMMNNLFSPLKDLDPKIRFLFITGITKFSQMSIFSALNNLKDISLDADYEAICGISKDEITSTMKIDLESFAKANNWNYDITLSNFKKVDGK